MNKKYTILIVFLFFNLFSMENKKFKYDINNNNNVLDNNVNSSIPVHRDGLIDILERALFYDFNDGISCAKLMNLFNTLSSLVNVNTVFREIIFNKCFDKFLKKPDVINCLFILACKEYSKPLIEFLLSKGTDINLEYIENNDELNSQYVTSPILIAVEQNDIKLLNLLIQKGVDVNKAYGKNQTTALIEACAKGHTEIVKILLSNSAILEKANIKGQTPLMAAIVSNNINIIDLLKDKVDFKRKFENGKNLLFYIIKSTLDESGKFNSYGLNKKLNLLNYLFANYPDIKNMINEQDVYGYTPLSFAIENELYEIADFLILNGADVNKQDINGITALMKAIKKVDHKNQNMKKKNLIIIKLLIEKGADCFKVDNKGLYAVDLARQYKYSEVLKILDKTLEVKEPQIKKIKFQ